MGGYYSQKLAARRLLQCYEIAPPRVRQYLEAEVDYVLQKIRIDDVVLEPGCGYGRIVRKLTNRAGWVIGIDSSLDSLLLGREMLGNISNCLLLKMDTGE